MTEYESTYKAKMELLKLLKFQVRVEEDIKAHKASGDTDTAKILSKRYDELNERIVEAAKSFIDLADD